MIAGCTRAHAGALASAGRAGGGFRLWPLFSVAAFRRRLLEALMCGVSRPKRRAPAVTAPGTKRLGTERLSELVMAEASEAGSDETEAEIRRKVEVFEELQGVVRRLQDEDAGRRRSAAMEVRRVAKDDPEARKTLAMFGSIPTLVGMLDCDDSELHIAALYALLNLGIGNSLNKAAIVKAGAVHNMLRLISPASSPAVTDAIVANFLGLSALDSNKPIIGASGSIPFLVNSFQNSSSIPTSTAKQDALRALFNLSILPFNIPILVDAGLVPALLAAVGDMEISDRALAVLSNLVAAPEGRLAVSRSGDAFPILVDVLNWCDSPSCQEKAAYILMVMAPKGYADRRAMIEAGIVSSLLELTLLGTPMAQKRASRILEILTVEKGKQVSAPFRSEPSGMNRAVTAAVPGEEEMAISEERRAVRQLVQQSLQSNMRRIARRANLPGDFAPSDQFKALTASSTSKSLPFGADKGRIGNSRREWKWEGDGAQGREGGCRLLLVSAVQIDVYGPLL